MFSERYTEELTPTFFAFFADRHKRCPPPASPLMKNKLKKVDDDVIIHVAVLVMILTFASQRKSYGGKKEKEIKKKKKLGRKRQGAWNLKHFDGKFHFEEKPTRAWDVVMSEPREEGKRASTTRVTTSGMRWVESKTVEKKKNEPFDSCEKCSRCIQRDITAKRKLGRAR